MNILKEIDDKLDDAEKGNRKVQFLILGWHAYDDLNNKLIYQMRFQEKDSERPRYKTIPIIKDNIDPCRVEVII